MDYIFPAVFFKDENTQEYYGRFDDVGVFFEGRTVEEAFFNARKYLKEFCKLSIKLYGKVQERARTYQESCEIHKGQIVLLVDAEFRSPKKGNETVLDELE